MGTVVALPVKMSAGDLIYNSPAFTELNRMEAMELLGDLLLKLTSDESDRLSNGIEVDAMLAVLDYLVITPEQMKVVSEFMREELS